MDLRAVLGIDQEFFERRELMRSSTASFKCVKGTGAPPPEAARKISGGNRPALARVDQVLPSAVNCHVVQCAVAGEPRCARRRHPQGCWMHLPPAIRDREETAATNRATR